MSAEDAGNARAGSAAPRGPCAQGAILRGGKPADLPVIQSTSFPLRVNLKAAKAFGLSIPESFPLLTDEVIE
ncbi:MAG: hypothetical protein WCB62_03560 [Pseudolabrys sp.]